MLCKLETDAVGIHDQGIWYYHLIWLGVQHDTTTACYDSRPSMCLHRLVCASTPMGTQKGIMMLHNVQCHAKSAWRSCKVLCKHGFHSMLDY